MPSVGVALAINATAPIHRPLVGIEAADFPLIRGVNDVKFEKDEKKIVFELTELTPPKLAEHDRIFERLDVWIH